MLVDPNVPEELYSHFAHAVTTAAQDIQHFAQTWEDPRSKQALEIARESRAKNEEDIRAWLVSEHADWLDVKEENGNGESLPGLSNANTGVKPTEWKAETVQAALAKLKELHPGIETSCEEESQTIRVWYTVWMMHSLADCAQDLPATSS